MAAEGLDPTLQKMLKIIQELAPNDWGRERHELFFIQLSSSKSGVFSKSSERKLNVTSHFFVANGVQMMAKGLSHARSRLQQPLA